MIKIITTNKYNFIIINTKHITINNKTLTHLIHTTKTTHIIPIIHITTIINKNIIKILNINTKNIIIPHIKDHKTIKHIIKLNHYYPQKLKNLNNNHITKFKHTPLLNTIKITNKHIIIITIIKNIKKIITINNITQIKNLNIIIKNTTNLSQSLNIP